MLLSKKVRAKKFKKTKKGGSPPKDNVQLNEQEASLLATLNVMSCADIRKYLDTTKLSTREKISFIQEHMKSNNGLKLFIKKQNYSKSQIQRIKDGATYLLDEIRKRVQGVVDMIYSSNDDTEASNADCVYLQNILDTDASSDDGEWVDMQDNKRRSGSKTKKSLGKSKQRSQSRQRSSSRQRGGRWWSRTKNIATNLTKKTASNAWHYTKKAANVVGKGVGLAYRGLKQILKKGFNVVTWLQSHPGTVMMSLMFFKYVKQFFCSTLKGKISEAGNYLFTKSTPPQVVKVSQTGGLRRPPNYAALPEEETDPERYDADNLSDWNPKEEHGVGPLPEPGTYYQGFNAVPENPNKEQFQYAERKQNEIENKRIQAQQYIEMLEGFKRKTKEENYFTWYVTDSTGEANQYFNDVNDVLKKASLLSGTPMSRFYSRKDFEKKDYALDIFDKYLEILYKVLEDLNKSQLSRDFELPGSYETYTGQTNSLNEKRPKRDFEQARRPTRPPPFDWKEQLLEAFPTDFKNSVKNIPDNLASFFTPIMTSYQSLIGPSVFKDVLRQMCKSVFDTLHGVFKAIMVGAVSMIPWGIGTYLNSIITTIIDFIFLTVPNTVMDAFDYLAGWFIKLRERLIFGIDTVKSGVVNTADSVRNTVNMAGLMNEPEVNKNIWNDVDRRPVMLPEYQALGQYKVIANIMNVSENYYPSVLKWLFYTFGKNSPMNKVGGCLINLIQEVSMGLDPIKSCDGIDADKETYRKQVETSTEMIKPSFFNAYTKADNS